MAISANFNTLAEVSNRLRQGGWSAREAVVIFVRHGETGDNVKKRLRSVKFAPDFLTPHGVTQMHQVSLALRDVPICWAASSGVGRAVQSLQEIISSRGLLKFTVCRMDGFDYGKLHGTTFLGDHNDFQTLYPDLYRVFNTHRFDFKAPDGESYPDFAARIAAGLREDIRPNCQSPIRPAAGLVVAHKTSIREAILGALGTTINEEKPTISTGSISVIHFGPDGSPDLWLLNYTGHLSAVR